jgi:hypothetical protein
MDNHPIRSTGRPSISATQPIPPSRSSSKNLHNWLPMGEVYHKIDLIKKTTTCPLCKLHQNHTHTYTVVPRPIVLYKDLQMIFGPSLAKPTIACSNWLTHSLTTTISTTPVSLLKIRHGANEPASQLHQRLRCWPQLFQGRLVKNGPYYKTPSRTTRENPNRPTLQYRRHLERGKSFRWL